MKKNYFGKMVNTTEQRDLWIKEHLKSISVGESIIDCGAGEQKYRKYCEHLQYTSQDFCQYNGQAVAGLDTNGKWDTSSIDIVSDIIEIPVETGSFDNVLCTEVLEHVKHPELAIKEFSRILGGVEALY